MQPVSVLFIALVVMALDGGTKSHAHVLASLAQFLIIWGAVVVVALLICAFAFQFVRELHLYGRLLKQDPNEAKDKFFFSLTGATPDTIRRSSRMRSPSRSHSVLCPCITSHLMRSSQASEALHP
jgi:hypothetical protein